jgi:NADH dehydrogenase/NADH:ubiquinone oxidoreductase subunit G
MPSTVGKEAANAALIRAIIGAAAAGHSGYSGGEFDVLKAGVPLAAAAALANVPGTRAVLVRALQESRAARGALSPELIENTARLAGQSVGRRLGQPSPLSSEEQEQDQSQKDRLQERLQDRLRDQQHTQQQIQSRDQTQARVQEQRQAQLKLRARAEQQLQHEQQQLLDRQQTWSQDERQAILIKLLRERQRRAKELRVEEEFSEEFEQPEQPEQEQFPN